MRYLGSQVLRQLHTIYKLTFQPDMGSAVYLNRRRLNIAALTMLALDVVYALLWFFLFEDIHYLSGGLLLFAGFCSALAFLNLHFRIVPWFSQLALVVFCLWLNMPFLGLYIYLVVEPHVHALANTIILLVLYMHIQDWRSSLLGILFAAFLTPGVYFLALGHWPHWPPVLQIFILATALGGAIVVAASSANLTKMRRRYAHKVLQVTQEQLQPALALQSELIGNMRFEARNILQNPQQRLEVDRLAQDLKEQVDQLGVEMLQLVQTGAQRAAHWQSVDLLPTSVIFENACEDLIASYNYEPAFLRQVVVLELVQDVVIEANGAEVSQALSALLHRMLQARLSHTPELGVLKLKNWQQGHMGKLRITLQPPLGDTKAATSQELPPFTAYIYQLFHIRWYIHRVFTDGTPSDIELSCPLPSHRGARLR